MLFLGFLYREIYISTLDIHKLKRKKVCKNGIMYEIIDKKIKGERVRWSFIDFFFKGFIFYFWRIRIYGDF